MADLTLTDYSVEYYIWLSGKEAGIYAIAEIFTDPQLLSILRLPRGTNFKVTSDEWNGLKELINR